MSAIRLIVISALLTTLASAQTPLGTAFTYQGQLKDGGSPASGLHDLRFRLYDASVGGAQVGATLCVDNVSVTDGLFTVSLDFGAQFAGQERFLEIEVRADAGLDCANPAGFTTLTPRQPLTAAPNALFASNAAAASNATLLNAQPALYYQNASNMITGTLADARLTANVALLQTNQTFTGGKAFSAAPAFTAAGAPFTVNSSTMVTNLNADLLDGLSSTAFLQSIPVPLTLSGTSGTHIIRGENASITAGASSIYGVASGATGSVYAGRFETASDSGRGVYGWAGAASGTTYGVYGRSDSPSGRGVYGHAVAATGDARGVFGVSNSTSGLGTVGYATAASGTTSGVYGQCDSPDGTGVHGLTTASGNNNASGVFGESAGSVGIGVYGRVSGDAGRGVFGYADSATGPNYGVYGLTNSADGTAVFGWAASQGSGGTGGRFVTQGSPGTAVYGFSDALSGSTYGGWFSVQSASGTGVFGNASATSGTTYGGRFENWSDSGRAVYGWAHRAFGSTYGGYFENASTSGRGVYAHATATTGDARGVYGISDSTSGLGVVGYATTSTGTTFGVYGQSDSAAGRAVYGTATATGAGATPYGVLGQCSTATLGYAVFANGDMGASGVKPFRIDHPTDPENKYLLHYAAESPEVINFYRGTVILDERGEAVVELPHYFAMINKMPSYQLTAVAAPMPMLHVVEKISPEALIAGEKAGPGVAPPTCSFRIAGGVPGGEVCWRVEAVRNDLRMRLHGAPVEREKTGPERGKYQHPAYYDQSPEMGMDYEVERQGGCEESQPEAPSVPVTGDR